MRLMIKTVLGWILNPALSSEKYLIFPDPLFAVDICSTFTHTNININPFSYSNIHVLVMTLFS